MSGFGLVQFYPPNGTPYDGGTITGITDTLNKSIATTEIVSLSTDCTFALESGTSNVYNISFIRRNPHKEDGTAYDIDDDYYKTSWKWPNEMWVRATSSMINRWQAQHDGFTMHINIATDSHGNPLHETDENGAPLDKLKRYTDLYPIVTKNVYIKSITYNFTAGNTDTISGSFQVVVGGRSTYKAATSTGNKVVNYELNTIAENKKRLEVNYTRTYTPIYESDVNYNSANEYTEYITKPEKTVSISYVQDGELKDLLLLKGNSNPLPIKDNDWEQEFSDELGLVTSCIVEGGPSKPFESISLKINMKRLNAEYPEVLESSKEDNKEENGLKLTPGESTIYTKVMGTGTYVVTEYKSTESSMTVKGYCRAAVYTALPWPTSLLSCTGVVETIIEVLSSGNYGLSGNPYTYQEIFSTLSSTDMAEKYQFKIKSGATVWSVLWHLAGMSGCRIFFTATKAFIIDYTKISQKADNITSATGITDVKSGNRLWLRDGLDLGYTPMNEGAPWVAPEGKAEITDPRKFYELDSLELHSSFDESRIGGRVTDSVDCPTTSEQTQVNCVTVKYKENDTDHTIYIGYWLDNGGEYGEKHDEVDYSLNKSSIEANYNTSDPQSWISRREKNYAELRARAEASYYKHGYLNESVDLSQVFESCPMEMARAYGYFVLQYRIEPLKEISFKLAENFPAQSASNGAESKNITTAFWSATFPTVCAVKRFTDIDQDLEVSSLGAYDDKTRYRSEKTFLTSYTKTYPEQQTQYVFGEVTPITLANNTSKTETMIKSR